MRELLARLRRRFPRHEWIPVTAGRSGARVWLLSGKPDCYLKIGDSEVSAETQRLRWLATTDVPVPEILDAGETAGNAWQLSSAVPGRSAAEPWNTSQRPAVIEAIARTTLALHAIPPAECPFDRRLLVAVPQAKANAAAGSVDLADLDGHRAGWTIERLLDELDRTSPQSEEVVVCHGDLCLPNLLLDPETLRVNGMIDVGRLGVSDRYTDLALLTRSLSADALNPQYGKRYAEQFFAAYGESVVDIRRIEFYRLLDEFY